MRRVIPLPGGRKLELSVSGRTTDTEHTPSERIEDLQAQLAHRDERIRSLEGQSADSRDSVDAANLLWIFGSARTGSSWLARMLRELNLALWNEPLIGELFGHLPANEKRWSTIRRRKDFVLSESRTIAYSKTIRRFILDNARNRFPTLSSHRLITIKEPHAAASAPLILEALPESRMLWLMRDPRDVAASGIDAHSGGWASAGGRDGNTLARDRAQMYLRDMDAASKAYEVHSGPKTLVRYEDLREDAFSWLLNVVSDLKIDVDDDTVKAAVAAEDWDSVPEDQKGAGKGKRKATPGGWREDLSAEQIEIVEDICAPYIRRFYS